ncbi:hypothetical protein Ddye_016520 [Dipteronia dyeriana]|uniref:Transposase MuDR plant domain-containing protein n=1 Tax=Dipteronia dyeriana TaxID=168575 RepID=A0AAD9U6Y3_9ROSI|nr:hypothetical protein Ddye_016520 [Dipteronia dyeriana]
MVIVILIVTVVTLMVKVKVVDLDGDSGSDVHGDTDCGCELDVDSYGYGHDRGDSFAAPLPWIIPGVEKYTIQTINNDEPSISNGRFYKGKIYSTKQDLKRDLRFYALRKRFEFRIKRSGKQRFEVGCKNENCVFKLGATKMGEGEYWQVRKYNKEHSCTLDGFHGRFRQASASIIGELYSPKLRVNGTTLKTKDIMTEMQLEYDANEQVYPLAFGIGQRKAESHGVGFSNNCAIASDARKTHALAALRACRKPFIDFYSDHYKKSIMVEAYSGVIRPVGHKSEWGVPEDISSIVVNAPPWVSQVGRPKKSRIPSSGEYRGKKSITCSWCKQLGHNRQNCPTPLGFTVLSTSETQPTKTRKQRKCGGCGGLRHNKRTCSHGQTSTIDSLHDKDVIGV